MSEFATIAALATAPAPAGLAVIRMSGPKTKTAMHALFRGKKDPISNPRNLVYGHIIDHKTGGIIDKGLAVFMPGPDSYTGEDIGEFQFHGSPLLVERILRSLFTWGITPAEPGEFTKRAFLNGKMDLVKAEAISDLVLAGSERALRLASEQLSGRFSNAIEKIGEPLRNALAQLEAHIDFPEEDIEPQELQSILVTVKAAKEDLQGLLKTYSYGATVKEGFRVLLCGRPNAGKSSILNLLLGKKRAIVSEESGTTRDLIEEEAIYSGYRFVFCDSAGIVETTNTVEKIGIELARERLDWADLVLFVADATDNKGDWKELLEEIRGENRRIWMITNKIDLNPDALSSFFCDARTCQQNFYMSAKTANGLQKLIDSLVEEVSQQAGGNAETSVVVTNERHRNCLQRAVESLDIILLQPKVPLEILTAELRVALSALEELVGKTTTEDILGRIFSKFCIGK